MNRMWTFKQNFEGSWTLRCSGEKGGEYIRVVDKTLMQRLLVESDLIRRLWTQKADPRLDGVMERFSKSDTYEPTGEIAFALTEDDYKNWLRDCYGPGSEFQYRDILNAHALDAVLLFSETPDLLEQYREACSRARKASKAIEVADQVNPRKPQSPARCVPAMN